MNNIANELRDIADKCEAGSKRHWAKAMRVGALQIEIWSGDIDIYKTRVVDLIEENKRLRAALTELLAYNKRTLRIGGIENGRDVKAGDAICAVLDKCEAALKTPNVELTGAAPHERE